MIRAGGGGLSVPAGGGYTGSNALYAIARWGVPCILASSGTMGNNGAVTAMTALPTTYSGGAWLYLPAGAVAAGVPAAATYVWFVASSTTAGTVYNSTWDGSGIPPVGTTTAYVTTGPGAFTGISTGEITTATVTIPAGAIGPNGLIEIVANEQHNTAAGNKIPTVRYSGGAGTQIFVPTLSTNTGGDFTIILRNGGVTNVQKTSAWFTNSTGTVLDGFRYTAVDTTAATTLVFTLQKATATNHIVLECGNVMISYGA